MIDPTHIGALFSFVFGAVVGSFLNVCIHRMPRGLSVNKPRRSFCPACQNPIPWYRNLPLISWLLLRGKCADCGAAISVRYFLVELLTALLFLAVWLRFEWIFFLPYVLFVSLLIIATFVDFEHTIIPDEVTIGGTVLGIMFCFAIPILMGTESHLGALAASAGGAALGFGLLFLVVEVGKKAFGKKKVTLEQEEEFSYQPGEEPAIQVGPEILPWEDLFGRESDRLILTCSEIFLNGEPKPMSGDLCFYYNRVCLPDGREVSLETIQKLSGKTSALVIPREAMGFGDVKFMATIGAFLGWQSVLFTLIAASFVGSIVGVGAMLLGGNQWSVRIPFGPYLALGALLWMFYGAEIWEWYFALMSPPPPSY